MRHLHVATLLSLKAAIDLASTRSESSNFQRIHTLTNHLITGLRSKGYSIHQRPATPIPGVESSASSPNSQPRRNLPHSPPNHKTEIALREGRLRCHRIFTTPKFRSIGSSSICASSVTLLCIDDFICKINIFLKLVTQKHSSPRALLNLLSPQGRCDRAAASNLEKAPLRSLAAGRDRYHRHCLSILLPVITRAGQGADHGLAADLPHLNDNSLAPLDGQFNWEFRALRFASPRLWGRSCSLALVSFRAEGRVPYSEYGSGFIGIYTPINDDLLKHPQMLHPAGRTYFSGWMMITPSLRLVQNPLCPNACTGALLKNNPDSPGRRYGRFTNLPLTAPAHSSH